MAAKPSSPRSKGMPKKRRRAGCWRCPCGPLVKSTQLMQDEPDDLAEGERDDREIVAAQAQHREAEDHAPGRGEQAGERQAHPEAQVEIVGEQGEGIGADRVEGDIAEVEQPGRADDDVQAPAEHDVGEHDDRLVEDVAALLRDERLGDDRKDQRDDQEQDRRRSAHRAGRASPSRSASRPTTPIRPTIARRTRRSADVDGHEIEADEDRGDDATGSSRPA